MRKSSKSRPDNTASSSIAAERLADYRGDSGTGTASGSSCNTTYGPVNPNVSPSITDTENTSGTSPATTNTCSSVLGKMNLSEDLYSGETHGPSEAEQTTETTTKEVGKVCCFLNKVTKRKKIRYFREYITIEFRII